MKIPKLDEIQAVGTAQGTEPQVSRRDTPWDRFLRAYCIVLAIIVACFFLAITVPVPWSRSTRGQIVLAVILGLIGARALASTMVRLGGTMVLEGFLKPAEQKTVAEAERASGTVRVPITLAERLGGALEGTQRILRPGLRTRYTALSWASLGSF
jgi:hypothetical protein